VKDEFLSHNSKLYYLPQFRTIFEPKIYNGSAN